MPKGGNAYGGNDRKEELAALARETLGDRPLLVVSNREPYEHVLTNGKMSVKKTVGGLVSALEPVMKAIGGTWIAWGSGSGDRQVVDEHDGVMIPPNKPAYRLRRIWLSKEEEEKYYEGHVNQTLWPLMHLQTEKVRFLRSEWDTYQSVNRRFAEAAKEELKGKEGVVWFQDYHFATAPAMLRQIAPGTTILQFWHIPWPPWEVFRQHPQRRAILEGFLGCDLIGMHIDLYCSNFLQCIEREFNIPVDYDKQQILLDDRVIKVRALPISIDADTFDQAATTDRVKKYMEKFSADFLLNGGKMALGVERSDYTKGIVLKLNALEFLFEQYPEWREKFTYVQVSPLSRQNVPAYRLFVKEMNRKISEINHKFQTETWKPIMHIKTNKSAQELVALFRLADALIISARNDGMNLVAKEYIASRVDERGVLVLSEFTGAAEEMPQSIGINPYDLEGFAHAIHTALTMSEEEQESRMKQLRQHVFSNTIFDWTTAILKQIAQLSQNESPTEPPLLLDRLDDVRDRMKHFDHFELFCDYDGVLTPIAPRPSEARLSDNVKELLVKLRDSSSVHVSVISGRALSDVLDLIAIERLTYAGNHGLEIKGPRLDRIHEDAEKVFGTLQNLYEDLRQTMRPFPGVIVENKQLGLALHYRMADPVQIQDILDAFYAVVEKHNADKHLRVTSGKQLLEARPNIPWDKGRAVLWILSELHGPDWKDHVLPFYLGDDVTDEDAFHALKKNGITIHVGTPPHLGTAAQYRMEQTNDAAIFLDWLTHEVQ